MTGSPVQGKLSFSDTKDEDVEKVAYLGIVNGVGGCTFHPNDPLTRERAAVMLTRLALRQLLYRSVAVNRKEEFACILEL